MTFYDDERKYRNRLSRIKQEFPESYPLIEEFAFDLIAQGISISRVNSYLLWLYKALKVVGKPLDDWDRLDIRNTINEHNILVHEGRLSEHSLRELKKSLRRFFKWLGKEELVNWYSLGEIEPKVSPNDLITEEEFNRMIEVCRTSRDRALLSLLYETGARIGEIGHMNFGNVSFDEYGAIIWLPRSKTRKRKLRVVYSTSYLSAWISDHPLKTPESPLWVKLSGKNAMKPMTYPEIYALIKRIAKKAGLKKKVYPHLFRHTRATRLLAKVPESIGARYMGWVNGSKMVKIYVHLASEDVDEAILRLHGIKTNGSKNDLKVRQCPRCSFMNPGSSRFCSRCGLPLNEDALKEVEEWEKRKSEALSQLTKPDFIKIFMSMQREIEMLKMEIEKLRNGDG